MTGVEVVGAQGDGRLECIVVSEDRDSQGGAFRT